MIAAAFLVVNGIVLFGGERLKRRLSAAGGEVDGLTIRGALLIGVWQCAALIPGISRSGVTMVGGLLAGLHHKEAARFSFLIATPIILGAAVLEVPKLLHAEKAGAAGITGIAVISGVVAGITAFLSIAFLMHYFKKHDFDALDPFAWYCIVAGIGSLALLKFVV
jgi:undecaprenyl-diphosphatase